MINTFLESDQSIFQTLGLSWEELLFHAIALIVLVLVLWRLLYKPIKNIIATQRQKQTEVFANNEKLRTEAEQTKAEYEKLLSDTKKEAERVAIEAQTKAQQLANNIIAEAEQKASSILATAHNECQVEKTRMQNEFKDNAADLVMDIATKVIDKKFTVDDNKKLIDECLKNWS